MKRIKKKQIIKYIKTNRKLFAIIGIALIVLSAIITAIVLYNKADRVNDALKAKNFEQVQVKRELLITTEIQTNSGTNIEGDTYYSGAEDESLSDGAADEERNVNSSTLIQGTEWIMKKDGDVIYEESGSDKYYFYTRDKQDYVLYYDTQFGMAETGEWVEIEADGTYWKPAFDFSILSTLDNDYLTKDGEYYIPKNNAEDMFFQILNVSQPELHTDCDIKFKFEKGKLIEIRANYTFDNEKPMEEIYTFTYENTKVKLPKTEAAN